MHSLENDVYDWLIKNAGPIIKYRTQKELKEEDASKFEDDLLSSRLVTQQLKFLKFSVSPTSLHHSKPEAFENCMGRLFEFGLKKGIAALDDRIQPYLDWLDEIELSKGNPVPFSWFYLSLIAGYLAMTGYSNHKEVNYIIRKRLENAVSFTEIKNFNEIYINPEKIGKIPKNFRERPILNPEIIKEHAILPNIHDFHCFLHTPSLLNEMDTKVKIETLVDFILSPEYQKLEPGYGILYQPDTRRFYSAGWSIHLFGYPFENDFNEKMQKSICFDKSNLLRLSLLNRLGKCRNHPWFKNNIKKLKSYEINDGIFQFPREMIPQNNSGYWVSGRALGLEEKRSTKKALQIESTFRFYEITKCKYSIL